MFVWVCVSRVLVCVTPVSRMHVRVLRGSPCAPHKLPSALRARTEMDTVSVVVPGSLRKTDYFGKAYTVYLVELQVGSTIWKLERRYRQFRELCDGVRSTGSSDASHLCCA